MSENSVYAELIDLAATVQPDFPEKGAKETDQNFLKRLMGTCANAGDEFDAMSSEAQDWYNSAVDAHEGNSALPVPTGYPGTEAPVAAAPTSRRRPAPTAVATPAAPVAAAPAAPTARRGAAPAKPVVLPPTSDKPNPRSHPILGADGKPLEKLEWARAFRKMQKEAGTPVAATAARVAKAKAVKEPKVRKFDYNNVSNVVRKAVLENPGMSTADIRTMLETAGHEFDKVTVNAVATATRCVMHIALDLGLVAEGAYHEDEQAAA